MRLAKSCVMEIWESLVRYANADSIQENPKQALEDFRTLVGGCMSSAGLVGSDSTSFEKWKAHSRRGKILTVVLDINDFELCRDVREGGTVDLLATKYQEDIRQVLMWLCTRNPELADSAIGFLRLHGTKVEWNWKTPANYDTTGKDVSQFLYFKAPKDYGSIVTPVCMFILHWLDRYHEGEKDLGAVIPVGLCEGPACNKFMVVQRRGRKRFHSDVCRVRANQGTQEEWAANRRTYRKGHSETLARMSGRKVKRRNKT
jgi:hypothetical protein